MHEYVLTHLDDATLLHNLTSLAARERATTAAILAHIAEVDARRLYAPAGYPSMHAYCVKELHLSEDAAFRRIRAARTCREFPMLFTELAEGRLHLAAITLLAPHLTADNVEELLRAASHKGRSEIEEFLAHRSWLGPVGPTPPMAIRAPSASEPDQLGAARPGGAPSDPNEGSCHNDILVPGRVGAPPSSERLCQITISVDTRDKLQYAGALLSHAIPTRNASQVLDRALDLLISKLERRKFGAPCRSREAPEVESNSSCGDPSAAASRRYIPAHIRRVVWERDRGQCTFVSTRGTRCATRRFLEFDHVVPVARGGRASVDGIRLRCRAHNQYEAERVFGRSFMNRKRQRASEQARSMAGYGQTGTAEDEQSRDVIAGLRLLGCRADEARRAVELTRGPRGMTTEECLRAALAHVGKRPIQRSETPGQPSAESG